MRDQLQKRLEGLLIALIALLLVVAYLQFVQKRDAAAAQPQGAVSSISEPAPAPSRSVVAPAPSSVSELRSSPGSGW